MKGRAEIITLILAPFLNLLNRTTRPVSGALPGNVFAVTVHCVVGDSDRWFLNEIGQYRIWGTIFLILDHHNKNYYSK